LVEADGRRIARVGAKCHVRSDGPGCLIQASAEQPTRQALTPELLIGEKVSDERAVGCVFPRGSVNGEQGSSDFAVALDQAARGWPEVTEFAAENELTSWIASAANLWSEPGT